jgi:lipopolysaccharide assembly protein A
MRFLCLLLLLAFVAVVVLFAWQNQQDVTVTFWNWTVTASVAAVAGACYLLGMLSGWTVVGVLRRSFNRASQILDRGQRVSAHS